VAAALVLLVETVGRLSRRWSRASWWPALFLALLIAQLAFWRLAWTGEAVVHHLTAADLIENSSFVVQGLAFPSAWLVQAALSPAAGEAVAVLWVVGAATAALLVWSALRHGRGKGLLLGLGWFVIAAVPALVARRGIADAPRFLYPAAAGIALVWATSLGGWLRRSGRWISVAVAVIIVALLGGASLSYVGVGMRLYEMAGDVLWDAVSAVESEQPVLLVNLPMRLTPAARVFPLGFEGFIPLTPEITAGDLVYVHTGLRDAADAAAFGIAQVDAPESYRYEVFGRWAGWGELAPGIRRASTAYLTRYYSDRILLVEAGGPDAADRGEVLARFGDSLSLLGIDGSCDAGGLVQLTARWRVEAEVPAYVTVFVHLIDRNEALAAQADGMPLLGMLPFWIWEPGEVFRDERYFEPVDSGDYVVRLGVWELGSGDGWPAEGHGDGVVSLDVSCP